MLNCFSAANVALITLCGFLDPMIFALAFLIPNASKIDLTALLALIPTPSLLFHINILVELYLPLILEISSLFLPRGTFTMLFLAQRPDFITASCTSFALAIPNPTLPHMSPTTTSAQYLYFLPPLTILHTFVNFIIFSYNVVLPLERLVISISAAIFFLVFLSIKLGTYSSSSFFQYIFIYNIKPNILNMFTTCTILPLYLFVNLRWKMPTAKQQRAILITKFPLVSFTML